MKSLLKRIACGLARWRPEVCVGRVSVLMIIPPREESRSGASEREMSVAAKETETGFEQAGTETSTKPTRSTTARRITAIARNTFREALRDRVLYNLVLFVLLLTVGAIFLGELLGGDREG